MALSRHVPTAQFPAALLALAVCLSSSASGQTRPQRQDRELPNVRVPFVPCKADGQIGPIEAPKEIEKLTRIDPSAAQKLAYYQSAVAPGLLAPRGWFCFGVYGSSGSTFLVRPEPFDENNPFPLSEIAGRVVMIDSIEGESSGRVEVAQVIARVFPKHMGFVKGVIDLFDFVASEITYGPYPTDKLTYRSDEVVEYVTPANSTGLGIMNFVKPSNDSIEGVAILQGPHPDLLFLTVRLPSDMQAIKSQIVQQVEGEAVNK
jgi:hypothetical protein